jgi:hypothetical protein
MCVKIGDKKQKQRNNILFQEEKKTKTIFRLGNHIFQGQF